jgi:DMSO/TMAO reductase YedYZ molybdopterin-dependent catalytic subunit
MMRMDLSTETGVSRRSFLELAAAGVASLGALRVWAEAGSAREALAEAVGKLEYLTPPGQFRTFYREKPRVDQFSAERLTQVGLDRATWQLEVVPDPESDCKVERPMTKEAGTALNWEGLMRLAERHAVRFLKALTCTNIADPQGMGLWEGVPLREVVWLSRPSGNVRRVYYYGYHNDDPKQRFQSSLPMGRVLEDAPWDLPVILCYKLNGQWLGASLGGPVRMIVPEAYGNKAVKWVQRVVLTNNYQANDTYALWNNDVESPMKTCARLVNPPAKAKAGEPLAIVGLAQVGAAGLERVQYSLQAEGAAAGDDPYWNKLEWRDAEILPPPADWGGGLPGGKMPEGVRQLDAAGKPREWPMRYTIAHWAAVMRDLKAGRYHLRCRTMDRTGTAQPLPRPLPRSGVNAIQQVMLTVEG